MHECQADDYVFSDPAFPDSDSTSSVSYTNHSSEVSSNSQGVQSYVGLFHQESRKEQDESDLRRGERLGTHCELTCYAFLPPDI